MTLSVKDFTRKLLTLAKRECYYSLGDTITAEIQSAGYVTNTGNRVYAAVPVSKRLPTGANFQYVSGKIKARQNNKYCYGSTASSWVTASSGYVYASGTDCGAVNVMVQMANETNVTNNSPIGIELSVTMKVVAS